ncbi:hypothetical protein Pelo_4565 [Pelomyxa schiedti]|nr:hypothetical protein Pelo_4565 [Pelomyxa schiedti]
MQESCRHLSPQATDLICKLLSNSKVRLGAAGMAQILSHPFFAGLDWRNIRKLKAPIIPKITSPIDTGNFDDFGEITDTLAGMIQNTSENWGGDKTDKAAAPRKVKSADIPFIGYSYRSFDAFRERTNQASGGASASRH